MADQYDLVKINELRESEGPDDDSLLALGDEETGALKKISYENLTKKINTSIEENTNDIAENKIAIEQNASDITEINSALAEKNNLLSTTSFSTAETTLASGDTNNFDITITRSGYTPIAVAGYFITGTNSTQINVRALDISSGLCRFYVRNMAGSNAVFTATVTILYVKN